MTIENLRSRFWILPFGLTALGMLVVGLVYSKPSTAAPGITWAPGSLSIDIGPGQTQHIPVSFSSSENISTATVEVVPELQSLVYVTPSSFRNIQKDQPLTVA